MYGALGQCLRRPRPRSLTTDATFPRPSKGDKVVVGMSGGVDSSVTAALLAEKDYDLSAIFMRNWDTRDEFGTDTGCEWEKDWEDVQQVCKVLGIPCRMVDLSRDYWNRVFEPSLRDWEDGVTPNPDVLCNREIKFGALLEHLPSTSPNTTKAWFATGHYARKAWTSTSQKTPTIRPKLIRAVDRTKDQTYFLASVSEQSLYRALFPLGHLLKSEVRELAKKFRLPTAERQESMGVCFIGQKRKFGNFIASYVPSKPGPIIDISAGLRIGTHTGLWSYTIGQGAKLSGMRQKMFVVRKDPKQNAVYVASGSDNPLLSCSSISVTNFTWIWSDSPPHDISMESGYRAYVKIRHKMEPTACTVRRQELGASELSIEFDTLQSGVAPGQIAVLYDPDDDCVLGCGAIVESHS